MLAKRKRTSARPCLRTYLSNTSFKQASRAMVCTVPYVEKSHVDPDHYCPVASTAALHPGADRPGLRGSDPSRLATQPWLSGTPKRRLAVPIPLLLCARIDSRCPTIGREPIRVDTWQQYLRAGVTPMTRELQISNRGVIPNVIFLRRDVHCRAGAVASP